ncbi:MAG TPA: hypothetical protein VEO75_03480, partial [Nitrososphaerales archaeon]|nr:hypothetical protein [Nitrososphaerales archaeon]
MGDRHKSCFIPIANRTLAMGAPAPSAADDKAKIEYELRGKTLKVYMYILKQGKPVGVREVQRELGFSSPSVAYHHIEKL